MSLVTWLSGGSGGGRESSAERRAKIAEWNSRRESGDQPSSSGGGGGREGSEERRAKIAAWNAAREARTAEGAPPPAEDGSGN